MSETPDRDDSDILAEGGNVALRKAKLDEAMSMLASTPNVCYPPRIFLSYKWESAEHKAYAGALADALIAQGWDVVIDRDFDPHAYAGVEEFVARLVTCGIFIALATPAYVVNAIYPPAHDPSWVFDECQSAMLGELRMHRIALTPDGELRIPEAQEQIFRLSRTRLETDVQVPFEAPAVYVETATPPTFDEIFSMPSENALRTWVSEHMTFAGERLSDIAVRDVTARLGALADEAPAAQIAHLRDVIAEFPRLSAGQTRLAHALVDDDRIVEALAVCTAALDAIDRRDGRRSLQRLQLRLLEQIGDRNGCFLSAIDLLERYPSDWYAHLIVGNHLDDLERFDARWAARNHLLVTTADVNAPAGAHNVLGVVYQKLGYLLCAQRCFNRALELEPSNHMFSDNLDLNQQLEPQHDLANRLFADVEAVGCSNCRAIYDIDDDRPVLCAKCGSARPIAGTCPACAADGVVLFDRDLPSVFRCPTCRRGNLELKSRVQL